ncbi:MAG: hypothetical protein Q8Q59_01085 [Luteolibacter sp.]|jgi:hypothetical protein|nr:hypothetical protein [Luteolibacter sp.]
MHAALRIILLSPALVGWAVADLPKKAPLMKYTGLWTNSPFTSKPPPPEQGQAANPLEDYALGGVSPIGSGYRVTLLNKKKPDERIMVDSDKPSGGFKILSVTRKAGDPLGTIVRMSSGSVSGTVSFDEALLKLAAAPAAAANHQTPPGAQPLPGQPQPGQPPQRQPRPRVVPPPAPAANNQARPQGAQPQSGQPLRRPDRRH